MRKLIEQVAKFGVVGIIAFIIDIGLMNLLLHFHVNNLVASTISFLISLAFNYLASMKYVFTHRDDMARWMEITIFFVASAIGLGINEVVIWLGTSTLPADAITSMHGKYTLYSNVAKIAATVIVSIWNFVIRKWLLDAPAPGKQVSEASISHRLGAYSLTHSPFGWK
ncbi:sugar translocase [Bombiscardovia apis]|uniref:Sugar translocase n=1 Tax=Bombiscardovia apis TaxID=2932182 RepID=A0ABM8BB36_9BIFI|nr:GtrA family protein [Bombiscardovia apis]BDR54122.1 sugar translocase [Bombiscardovia apis]